MSTRHRQATVDSDQLTGDEARALVGQEHQNRPQIAGRVPECTAQRDRHLPLRVDELCDLGSEDVA
ncbi:hypothetical protein A5792_07890 [Mycolicibacterium peregrinum]|uniref:Uncharacterized protein n=1 Tax=Mycolicibacterium peregrinum TaxID=43304 RepID=A0A1A0QI78_MYCPR|nr:hypothetical protein A5792_07890 [Mycolicibacterium peregrinum]